MSLHTLSVDRNPSWVLFGATDRHCWFQVCVRSVCSPSPVYSQLVSWHSGLRSQSDLCITSAQGGGEAGTNPRVPTRPAGQGRLSHAALLGPGLQRERPLLHDVGSAAKGCPQAHVCLRYPALCAAHNTTSPIKHHRTDYTTSQHCCILVHSHTLLVPVLFEG